MDAIVGLLALAFVTAIGVGMVRSFNNDPKRNMGSHDAGVAVGGPYAASDTNSPSSRGGEREGSGWFGGWFGSSESSDSSSDSGSSGGGGGGDGGGGGGGD
jgi:hypothetical protein